MAQFKPLKIPRRWRDGYALDYQTISSEFIGYDEFGRPRFETTRTEIGELLYKLKYQRDQTTVQELVDSAVGFLAGWKPGIDAIVPVPPSTARAIQPVITLGDALAKQLDAELGAAWIRKTKATPELKDIFDFDERLRLLHGAFAVEVEKVRGRRILLFDDLYRSGATMNEISATLYDQGGAAEVFALAITRTRSTS